ncbi:hypothetical protein EsDP_00007458 [Epichloe bromicola]|uniref:Ring-like domain-containing protein n=1 Tax=Epichloe bromicola TaxID=79588 RepID=A0ABQ0D0P0_9HYPO
MIEYFTYKKVKKHKAEKAAKEDARKEAEASRLSETGPIDVADASRAEKHHRHTHDNDHDRAVIRPGDESFLEELIASDDAQGPPLPPRLYSRDLDWPSDNEEASARPSIQTTTTTTAAAAAAAATTTDTSPKDKEAKKQGRLSSLFSRKKQPPNILLRPNTPATGPTTLAEQEKEEKDLSKVLDRLNLSVKNNKVISTDSSAAITSFTNVFKDLVNGVPTAYDDLMSIIEDKDGALARGFDKLPSSLKKLVTQLPDKITSTLGPELLAAAAASQGIKAETSGGLKGTAKNVFMPANLTQLVTKPGAIVGMLKAIVGVLRTRWPAFIGLNVIWGVALSLLLFVLWYCHKRGREVRLESERSIDGSDRIEELPDDLALPAPEGPRRVETLLGEVETPGEARGLKGKARAEACQA